VPGGDVIRADVLLEPGVPAAGAVPENKPLISFATINATLSPEYLKKLLWQSI